MKLMKIPAVICSIIIIGVTSAQAQVHSTALPWNDRFAGGIVSSPRHTAHHGSAPAIALPGTTSMGLEGQYQQQFGNRSLHNIVADPDNPNNLHAAITFAEDVSETDTIAGKNFLPQLRVYYLFSSNAGQTWSAPKPIDTARTSIPILILMKRGTEYVPVISAVRNVADTTTPNFCSLYIEQGAAGEGNFKEFRTDRKTFYDSLRNINFPSIALSHDGTKIFMAAGIDNYDPQSPQYIQFSTFTLSEDKKSVTWGGWQPGPNPGSLDLEDPIGFAFPWSITIRVSPAGKLGIIWLNRDYGTPDLSIYLSESNDDGATWPEIPKLVLAPVETQYAPGGVPYFFVAFNSDFWYNDEQAEALLGGFYYNLDTAAGFYVPASGTVFYWNDKQSEPIDLISKEDDTQFGPSVVDGSWLSNWQQSDGVDVQGLWNVMNPTVARGSNPNYFAVYFNGWQDGDIQDMSEFGTIDDGTYGSYPYYGIWRATTSDGGKTFFGPEPIRFNDPLLPDDQKYDYRGLETALMNPPSLIPERGVSLLLMYNADSLAGVINYGGNPGLDNVSWLFQKTEWLDVRQSFGENTLQAINYPNPFSSHTTIAITLTEASTVTIEVSDLLGRKRIYRDVGILTSGDQKIDIDSRTLGNGSYPYVITAGERKLTGILTVQK